MTSTKPTAKSKNHVCDACKKFSESTDRAHIKSRGAGGTWAAKNILTLCRPCHVFQHSKGWCAFVTAYPNVGRELELRGWQLEMVFGVMKLRRKDGST